MPASNPSPIRNQYGFYRAKLVQLGRKGKWELYDLQKDRTELHDLASILPEVVKELSSQWEAWAVRAQVKPYPSEKKLKSEKRDTHSEEK